MPEFTEIIFDWLADYPLLYGFAALVAWWARYNWAVLNNDKKPESIHARLDWLREDRYGVLYIYALGWLLDKVSNLIGDFKEFETSEIQTELKQGWVRRCFGINPWSEPSYIFSLTLALFYPIITFLIFWAAGGSGSFGSETILGSEIEVWLRWFLLFSLLVLIWILLKIVRLLSWWRWLAAVTAFAITSIMLVLVGQGDFVAVMGISTGFFLLLFSSIYFGGFVTALAIHRSLSSAHREVYNLAFSLAFALAFTLAVFLVGAGAGVGTVAGAGAFSVVVAVAVVFAAIYAFSGASAVAVVFAVVFAVSGAFAVVIAGADVDFILVFAAAVIFASVIAGAGVSAFLAFVNIVYSRISSRLMGIYWLSYSLVFIVLAYAGLNLVPNFYILLLLLFFLLLPLINAPLDWLSLGVTRGLLQAIRSGHHATWQALLWALADFVLAIVLLLLITSISVLAIELGNGIAGEVVFDLIGEEGLFNGIRETGDNIDYYWIYFALFSTVIPTVIHLALAGGAATLWLPGKLREWIVKRFDRNHDATVVAWIYISFTPVVGFVLVPGTLLYAGWWLISEQGGDGKDLLLDWMTGLAIFVHGWFL